MLCLRAAAAAGSGGSTTRCRVDRHRSLVQRAIRSPMLITSAPGTGRRRTRAAGPGRARTATSGGRRDRAWRRSRPSTPPGAPAAPQATGSAEMSTTGTYDTAAPLSWPFRRYALRPARSRNLDVDGQDLAAAGRYHLGLGHAPPFGGHDEQRGAVRAPEGAGETAAIQVDGLEHGAARRDAHAPPVGHVGVPDGVLSIGADAIRGTVAEVGPDAPSGKAAIHADVEADQLMPVGVRDDQGGVVRGHRHPVGERDVAGHLAHGAVRGDQVNRTRPELLA